MLVIVLLILVVNVIIGVKNGFIKTVFMTFGIVIALIVSAFFSPAVGNFLMDTPVYTGISNSVEKALFEQEDGKHEFIADTDGAINELPIPTVIKRKLIAGNNSDGYLKLNAESFRMYVAGFLTLMIFRGVTFIIGFVVALILLRIIANFFELLAHLPVLKSMNRLGGGLVGLLHGLITVWSLFILVAVFSSSGLGHLLFEQINAVLPLKILYNLNPVILLIAGILG